MHHITLLGRNAGRQFRAVLYERMEILIDRALSNADRDPSLASRQASLALRLCSRHRIGMPYHIRMLFCRRCKSFVVPGLTSRVRVGGSGIRSVRTTCLFCGFVYRKMLAHPKDRPAKKCTHSD